MANKFPHHIVTVDPVHIARIEQRGIRDDAGAGDGVSRIPLALYPGYACSPTTNRSTRVQMKLAKFTQLGLATVKCQSAA